MALAMFLSKEVSENDIEL